MKMKLKTRKRKRKRKSDGSVGFNPVGHLGSNWHWPVILPLQRVGGCRCSVKPASRIALIFRYHWTQSLSSSPLAHLFAWNGRARLKASLRSDQLVWTKVPSHLCPHLGYKLTLLSSAICRPCLESYKHLRDHSFCQCGIGI